MALALPVRSSMDTVNRYDKELAFIENMMINDPLWEQVIQKRVKVPPPVKIVNHFAVEQPRPDPGTAPALVVNPLNEVIKLMLANVKRGTEVAFVMESIRRAVACSITQHVSMQAFLLHWLYEAEPTSKALPYVTEWLKQMTQLAVDKLTAVDWSMPAVALLYRHTIELLQDPSANNRLNEIGKSVLLEADAVCAQNDGSGVFAELIVNLKTYMTEIQLGEVEYMMANDDDIKGLPELNKVKLMIRDHGSLTIDNNVDAAGLGRLSTDELKKMMTVNRVKMNYVYKNLPVAALAVSQWNNLLALNVQQRNPLVGHQDGHQL